MHTVGLAVAGVPLSEVVRSERHAVPTRIRKRENGASPPVPCPLGLSPPVPCPPGLSPLLPQGSRLF